MIYDKAGCLSLSRFGSCIRLPDKGCPTLARFSRGWDYVDVWYFGIAFWFFLTIHVIDPNDNSLTSGLSNNRKVNCGSYCVRLTSTVANSAPAHESTCALSVPSSQGKCLLLIIKLHFPDAVSPGFQFPPHRENVCCFKIEVPKTIESLKPFSSLLTGKMFAAKLRMDYMKMLLAFSSLLTGKMFAASTA